MLWQPYGTIFRGFLGGNQPPWIEGEDPGEAETHGRGLEAWSNEQTEGTQRPLVKHKQILYIAINIRRVGNVWVSLSHAQLVLPRHDLPLRRT